MCKKKKREINRQQEQGVLLCAGASTRASLRRTIACPILPRRPRSRPILHILLLLRSSPFMRARLTSPNEPTGIRSPPASPRLEGMRGRVRARGDMRVASARGQKRRVEVGEGGGDGGEVLGVVCEGVCGLGGETDAVLGAGAEFEGLVGDFVEEVAALFGGGAFGVGVGVGDEVGELEDVGGDAGDGCGEDCVVLAELCEDAGDVEGEGVEDEGVLVEEVEGVGGAGGRCGCGWWRGMLRPGRRGHFGVVDVVCLC